MSWPLFRELFVVLQLDEYFLALRNGVFNLTNGKTRARKWINYVTLNYLCIVGFLAMAFGIFT